MLTKSGRGGVGKTMKLRAENIRPGQQIDGAEVVWVLPVPDRASIMVAVDARLDREDGGAATRIQTFRRDEWVDVDERWPCRADQRLG
jgi:hypothetical protein